MPSIKYCTNFVCGSAISILVASTALPVYADIPKISKQSPLYPLMEEYFSDDAGGKGDPLRAPELKKESDGAVQLGWKYFNGGDHQTALKRFLVALRMDDQNATAYFGIAYVCSVDNNIDEAILFYREALRYQKNYAPIYANLGRALLMKDPKSAEAEKLLQQGIVVDPKFPETYITYSRYLVNRGEWKLAAEQAQKAISLGRKIDPQIVDEFQKHGVELKQ